VTRDGEGAHQVRDDIRVQCWCGAAFPYVPRTDYDLDTVVYCGADCGGLPALTREPKVKA
jgi:hypothetical protein